MDIDFVTFTSWSDAEWVNALDWGLSNFNSFVQLFLLLGGLVTYGAASNWLKLFLIMFGFAAAWAVSVSDQEEEKRMSLQKCSAYFTPLTCELEALGETLDAQSMKQTFERDPEWALYRKNKCTIGMFGSAKILEDSYSVERWKGCEDDEKCISAANSIREQVRSYSCPFHEMITIREHFAMKARQRLEEAQTPYFSGLILFGCTISALALLA